MSSTASSSSASSASLSDPDLSSASAWWYTNPGTGATRLRNRCMRTFGWSIGKTVRVSEGYRLFLELKRDLKDWDAKILSPSVPVDQMWHQHILDVANYVTDCQLLCGHLVGHNPDGMLDAEARARRVETTRHILQSRLGRLDEEVWNFGGGVDAASSSSGRKRSLEAEEEEEEEVAARRLQARAEAEEGQVHPPQAQRFSIGYRQANQEERLSLDYIKSLKVAELKEELKKRGCSTTGLKAHLQERLADATGASELTIRIRDQTGEETYFKIKETTRMGKVFNHYAERKGIAPSTLRFLLDAERVPDDATARMLELEEGDQIDAILDQAGC